MNPYTERLRIFTERRTRQRDLRIRQIGRDIDRWTRQFERRLLGIVAAGWGGLEGVMGSATVLFLAVPTELAAVVEEGLRDLWEWSWESATRDFVRVLPLRFWVARHLPSKAMLGTESHPAGVGLLEIAGDLRAEVELQKILDGKVPNAEAREIVRQIEFPAPSAARVDQILTDTSAYDGMSAMQRIKTVEAGRLGELRQVIVTSMSQPGKASAVNYLAPRLRELVGNDPGKSTGMNYRAKRIARTEGVRVAETGLRETWKTAGDLIQGIRWYSALLPQSRASHKARHRRVYRRDARGSFVAKNGEELPPIPLGPNCMCWSTPELIDDLTQGLPPANYGAYDVAKARSDKKIAQLGVKRKKVIPVQKPTAVELLRDKYKDLEDKWQRILAKQKSNLEIAKRLGHLDDVKELERQIRGSTGQLSITKNKIAQLGLQ